MKRWIILGICILNVYFSSAYTNISYKFLNNRIQSNEIKAVINKNTTEKELEDLKSFFAENDIELIIRKINYNDKNEITGLSIILKQGNSKSQYSSHSSQPIAEVELGSKGGNLYIKNKGTSDISALGNIAAFSASNFSLDSIMKQHNFIFDFNEENDSLSVAGSFDIQKLKDQIMKSFSFDENEDSNFFFNGQPIGSQNLKNRKYNFVDNPDIEKLIIIDGKEADFKTLDNYAKSDKLVDVDFLKPSTAVSIYGEKAKDGAIIATTRK